MATAAPTKQTVVKLIAVHALRVKVGENIKDVAPGAEFALLDADEAAWLVKEGAATPVKAEE